MMNDDNYFTVGSNYFYGENGCDKNLELSIENYILGSESGCVKCMFRLACCYKEGIGVEVNNYICFDLFKQASDRGYVIAYNNLGNCYKEGIGTNVDPQLALYWFNAAIKNKSLAGFYNIAEMMLDGLIQKDDSVSF